VQAPRYVLEDIHGHFHCNAPQHAATHCIVLQHTATHCIVLQHTASYCNNTLASCNTLHYNTTLCNILHHIATTHWPAATHCIIIQHSVTYCIILQQHTGQLQHTSTHIRMQVQTPCYILGDIHGNFRTKNCNFLKRLIL